MTHREHVLAALRGEKTDRIPWLPEINGVFAQRQVAALGLDAGGMSPWVRLALEIGAASFLSGPFVREEMAPDVQREVVKTDGAIVERITTPHGVLQSRRVWDENACTHFCHEFLIKGPQDYEGFEHYYVGRRFTTDAQAFQAALEPVLDYGIVALAVPATPYMDCIMNYVGIEATMYQLFDHRKAFLHLADAMHQKNLEYCRMLLDAPVIDIVRPFEDTSSMLCSPETFERICKPHLQDYADLVHSRGHRFVPHMCGHLKAILPHMRDLDIDGIEAVTPPPTGDCTARAVRDALGADKIIIGGFDAASFARDPLDRVMRELRNAIEPMRDDPRFVLGNEEISPAAKWENVLAVAEVLKSL
jgi:hypothetical protein